jgi:aminotransferase in exopolysaccharide biosynthesis
VAGVENGDEVITQPLTFVATANAISHAGAKPIFIDVDMDTMGLSPKKLMEFLVQNCERKENYCLNKVTGKKIKAVVPMHTFGFPCRIEEIVEIAEDYNISVLEDAAESLGSFYKQKHTGTFGLAGILSYNGNKTVTTGGGGMVITDNEELARKAKHLTTTGKIPHKWEYKHDLIAYNYRMTNLNAAIGVAQMEYFDKILNSKQETANLYKEHFCNTAIKFFTAPKDTVANYWLNVIQLKDKAERDSFLEYANSNGVMTRPIWCLMNSLEMYKDCQKGNLDNSEWLEERVVNIPSGYRK